MTAKQFIKKFPDAEINGNCLEDIACPQCGSRGGFRIQLFTGTCDAYDDGTGKKWSWAFPCSKNTSQIEAKKERNSRNLQRSIASQHAIGFPKDADKGRIKARAAGKSTGAG